MKKEQTFTFRESWLMWFRALDDDVRHEAHDALLAYAFHGVEPPKSLIDKGFSEILKEIDTEKDKAEEISKIRRTCGTLGGMAARTKSKCKQMQANASLPATPSTLDLWNAAQAQEAHEYSNYEKFLGYVCANAPYVAENIPAMTEKQFGMLRDKYGSGDVADVVMQLENRKDLRKKYTSLYLTLNNWLRRKNGTTSQP